MTADAGVAVAEVLWLPFSAGALDPPSADPGGAPALFLRARPSRAMTDARASGAIAAPICEQSFKPEADALRRAGFEIRAPADLDSEPDADVASTERHPCVLLLPPRQRDEARSLFARAVAACADGGTVVACMANDEGAKSGESDLERLAGLSGSLSKRHCRVFWARVESSRIDLALLAQWRRLDAPRRIEAADFPGGGFVSRPGVFAWDRIDPASALLAAHLPDDLRGRAADLGCGYGYLSAVLLRRCPRIDALHLYEAEARALALARRNLAAQAHSVALDFRWHDVAAGLPERYDVVVSNPPFHAIAGADRPDIGRAFIAAAADALNPRGRLWLVANRHLPYEHALAARFAHVRTVAQARGFKVIEGVMA